MLNFILSVAGLLCLVGAMIVWGSHKKNNKKGAFDNILVIVGISLIVASQSFTMVPTGYTGIRITFGQIDERTVPNGPALKIPFIQSIEQMNNKQQDISFNGQIWSETAERTALYYDGITVTYQISKDKSAWIYSNVSNYKDTLLTHNLVASAIKTASKTLDSVDATNRGIIEPLTLQEIQNALDEKYGENTVIVTRVTIADADFEQTYNEAIAQKQNAQLQYEQQQIENKKAIEAAEAQAKVKLTQENAEAQALKIQAEAEAEAILIRAKAEAEANEILSQSITDEIIAHDTIQNWNGQLPYVQGENGVLFDISSIVGSTKN